MKKMMFTALLLMLCCTGCMSSNKAWVQKKEAEMKAAVKLAATKSAQQTTETTEVKEEEAK